MKVYLDDILVKNVEADQHITDLNEAFNELRSYQMKLNPSKYAFGVNSKKFLGFMMTQ